MLAEQGMVLADPGHRVADRAGHGDGGRPQVEPPLVGARQSAAALTLKQGDYEHNGTSERTEFAANPVSYKPGDEFWVATSIYLDSTFPLPPAGGWALFHQFYGATGGQSTGSPPIALEVTPSGNFLLTVRGGVKSSDGARAPKDVGHTIAPVTRGEWHDFLLHIRLAKGSSGIVEVWHRIAAGSFPAAPSTVDAGVNVLTVAGVDQDVYPETGYYRSTDARPGDPLLERNVDPADPRPSRGLLQLGSGYG